MSLTSASQLKVVVFFQDDVVRLGVEALLRPLPSISSVFGCGNTEDIRSIVGQYSFDLVLVDHETFQHWLQINTDSSKNEENSRILIISDQPRDSLADSLNQENAVTILHRGPHIGQRLREAVAQFALGDERSNDADPTHPAHDDLGLLSPSEKNVLVMLASGLSTKAIASQLFVSTRTIETHRAQISRKLNIRSIAGLTKFAIRVGISSLYSM